MESSPIKNDLVILFVAAITPRKGLHYLLEAFDKIASKHLNVKLKIVGMWDWAPDYVLGLKENFSQHINTKKIEFSHNPFSMPQGDIEKLDFKNPLNIKAYQYDIVCNGVELSER